MLYSVYLLHREREKLRGNRELDKERERNFLQDGSTIHVTSPPQVGTKGLNTDLYTLWQVCSTFWDLLEEPETTCPEQSTML